MGEQLDEPEDVAGVIGEGAHVAIGPAQAECQPQVQRVAVVGQVPAIPAAAAPVVQAQPAAVTAIARLAQLPPSGWYGDYSDIALQR